MEKIKNNFYKFILILLIFMVFIASMGAVLNIYNTTNDVLHTPIILLGVIVELFVFIALFKNINKLSDKTISRLAIAIFICFFGLLSFFGVKNLIVPSFDLSHIERELGLMINKGPIISNASYFAKYTNQVPLTIFLYYIYYIGNLLHVGNLRLFATIINSLSIAITAYITYLSISHVKNKKYGLLALIFFVINPIFYLYSSYYYSDTLSMPFSALAIYLFLLASKNMQKKYIILFILSGVFIACGFEIRVVVAILLIAMILSLLLNNKFKLAIKCSIGIIIGFLLGVFNYKLIATNFEIPTDDNLRFPLYHWVMMGLNEKRTGRYSEEDHIYTKSKPSYALKKEADLNLIKSRLKKLGIKGWYNLFVKKIIINWSNGAYRYLDKTNNVENVSGVFEYTSGNNVLFILYWLQMNKCLILLILLYMLIRELLNKNKCIEYKFIYIAIFGAFMFYSIWEVQSRYSLSFLPWMILLFPFAISSTNEHFEKIKPSIKSVFSWIILLTSIILLITNYKTYAVNKDTYYDMVINQAKDRGELLAKIYDKEIKQTFITDKEFNVVSVKFMKNSDDLSTYLFSLYDNKDRILYSEIFTSDDVTNDRFKKFRFDMIKPKEEETYSFKISSISSNSINSLGIYSYGYSNYSVYPNGSLYINGSLEDANMTFRVQKRVKRSYVPVGFYITLSLIIIGFQIFAFKAYLFKFKNHT